MMSLRGIFPVPQKEPKKNFIRENVKQLKLLQCNRQSNENRRHVGSREDAHHVNFPLSGTNLPSIRCHKSNPQLNKMPSYNINTASCNGQCLKQNNPPRIKKANMSEFLKRKQHRENNSRSIGTKNVTHDCQEPLNIGITRPIAVSKDASCQYVDPDTALFLSDGDRIRVIYPSKQILDLINKKSKDQDSCSYDYEEDVDGQTPAERLDKPKEPGSSAKLASSRYMSENNLNEIDRINKLSISSPKKTDVARYLVGKDDKPNPFMAPPAYQKGVVPKYIQERKEQLREAASVEVDDQCPPGHMALPECERIETLDILKKKFEELVNELNKMPVRSDTLRMRNRKMQLDKELEKLEEGIKVFSRPNVHIKL